MALVCHIRHHRASASARGDLVAAEASSWTHCSRVSRSARRTTMDSDKFA